MKLEELRERVREWDLSRSPDDDPAEVSEFNTLLQAVEFYARKEWGKYLPTFHANYEHEFLLRLARWLGNVTDEDDQKLLLRYVAKRLAFISQEDFWALHLSVFEGPITRWIIEQTGLTLGDANFFQMLEHELYRTTWFCPVTDSMDINEFYHANHIKGIKHRPGFATLAMLDETSTTEPDSRLVANLRKYISDPDPDNTAPALKRLVLLEDFVGTGTQSAKAVKWALAAVELPVLFVPLIICPQGMEKIGDIAAKSGGRLSIRPGLQLRRDDLLGPERKGTFGCTYTEKYENLIGRTFSQVAGSSHKNSRQAPHTEYGFLKTGCSVVTYSNTPNNTLPLVHHEPPEKTWTALFPRSSRL